MSPQSVIFQTELFVWDQSEDDIDQWFVGGDCAGWFYARLLPFHEIHHDCDPVMEDWGWYFSVNVHEMNVKVSCAIYPWLEREHHWAIVLQSHQKMFRKHSDETLKSALSIVTDKIDQLISGDERFELINWLDNNPFNVEI